MTDSKQTEFQLTLSPQASPAKTSAMPGKAQELKKALAPAYGQRLPDLLASYDPATSSWRTSQLSLEGGLTLFSETWPRSGTMQNGIAYQLQPLVRLIGVTGGGAFRTPVATEGSKEPTGSLTKQVQNGHPNANKDGSIVAHLLKHQKMPTPVSRDSKGGYTSKSLTRKDGKSRHLDALPNAVLGGKGTDEVPGKLNPTWVEWLMGYPSGWTDLKD